MDHRSVPLDVLREFARDESERTSLRQVAANLGLGRTTLQKFINAETTPHPRIRRQIALWYLASRDQARSPEPEPDVDAAQAALQVLVGDLPEEYREGAIRQLITRIEQLYASQGIPAPGWGAALRPGTGDEN